MDIRFQLHHQYGFPLAELAQQFAIDLEAPLDTESISAEDAESWFSVEQSIRLPAQNLLSTIRLQCPLPGLVCDRTSGEVTDYVDLFLTNLTATFPRAGIRKIVCLDNEDVRLAAQEDYALLYHCEMQIRQVLYHILTSNGKLQASRQGAEELLKHLNEMLGTSLQNYSAHTCKPYENELFFLTFDQYRRLKFPLPTSQKIMEMLTTDDSFGHFRTQMLALSTPNVNHQRFLQKLTDTLENLAKHRNVIAHNRSVSTTRADFWADLDAFHTLVSQFWNAEPQAAPDTQATLIRRELLDQLTTLVASATISSSEVKLKYNTTLLSNRQPKSCYSRPELIAQLYDFCDEALEYLAPITPGQADEARDELDLQGISEQFAQRFEESGVTFS